jgi:acetylornithine/N-succinyldiaminopimelate aminotransferase
LRQLCDALGLLLILDEVQTGMGRCGSLFAHQQAGVRPDIMTLGKGLGGGVPIAALLASERASCFEPGDQGGTYTGHPLMCAVAQAVLQQVTAGGFLDQVQARAEQWRQGLAQLALREAGQVSGRGLLWALALPQAGRATQVASWLAERPAAPVLVNAVRPDRLRFMPALTISAAETALALEALDAALRHTRA